MNHQICVITETEDIEYWSMSHENNGILWHSCLVVTDKGVIVKNRFDNAYIEKTIRILEKCLEAKE